MRVFVLPANESWIVDDLANDFYEYYPHNTTRDPNEADILWLMADWAWRQVPMHLLRVKKVVTTVHHIVPEKFGLNERTDFDARDEITDLYHVYNLRTWDFVSKLTAKPVVMRSYWANQYRWKKSVLTKAELRAKHGLPANARILMSAQRDTEGFDLLSPKREKGPEELVEACRKLYIEDPNVLVLLGGWRRQFVTNKLTELNVPFVYFERPSQPVLSELYQCADLYLVTANCEGGPQSLLETGLLDVPVVSTPVGIAEQVLPSTAIGWDVTRAIPAVPNVETMKLPYGMEPYEDLFARLLAS